MAGNIKKEYLDELQRLGKKHKLLSKETVVAEATPKSSPLHDYFEWDNRRAGAAYRLQQARYLLRMSVVVEPQTQTEHRLFVSLTPDRVMNGSEDEGGYRMLSVVMGEPELRALALADAKSELAAFKRKYAHLTELAGVFAEIDKVV